MASRTPAKSKTPVSGVRRPGSAKAGARGASARGAAVRGAIDPHRDDLIGLAVIVVGVLLGLAVYFEARRPARPRGEHRARRAHRRRPLRAAQRPSSPAVSRSSSTRRSEHRVRLALGVGLAVLAMLGLLHIAARAACGHRRALHGGPGRRMARRARRASRCADCSPPQVPSSRCRSCSSPGSLIATRASLRRVAGAVGRGVKTGAVARVAEGEAGGGRHVDAEQREGAGQRRGRTRRPRARRCTTSRPRTRRSRRSVASGQLPPPDPGTLVGGAAEQLEIDLGPGAQKGQWKLPPVYLPGAHQRAGGRPRARRGAGAGAGGRARLARRGDPARRHDRRPDGHPLRARARGRREGGAGHHPPPGHRLRHGRHRRPHPGAHPGPLGDRRRGAEPDSPPRLARRHPHLARGRAGHPPARRGDRQGHRRAVRLPQPRHHAAPAHRRRHRRGQVERHQLPSSPRSSCAPRRSRCG